MKFKHIPMTKRSILVVDDNPANLALVVKVLDQKGYQLFVAEDGESALELLHFVRPDLILLDVMMPGMNGFEICRRLKIDDSVKNIPVIFMTALSNVTDKVRGFEVGGVDYITKPIQVEEMLARVKTHLTIRQLQEEMSERIKELDAFAHTTAHDLKNPLSRIITSLDLLQEEGGTSLNKHMQGVLQISLNGSRQMATIIDELLLLASVRQQDVVFDQLPMLAVVINAKHRLQHMLNEYDAEIIYADEWPKAVGYAPWLEEVWVNLISNGLKYGGRPPCLELGGELLDDGMTRFWIRDNGQGLSKADQAKLFQEFSRIHAHAAKGHGLGLSIVSRIVHRLGGEVGIESKLGEGSTFYFTLHTNSPTL